MADKKISALTAASTPLAGTEVLPIVQSGATVKVAVSDLTAGRAISATAVTASTGNFVVGTSGQGIDFSATPGTGTSELLADYEEGTWTPTISGLTLGNASGVAFDYVKVGDIVTVTLGFVWGSTTSSSGTWEFSVPFAASTGGGGSAYLLDISSAEYMVNAGIATISFGGVRVGTNTTGFVSGTTPFTWAVNDRFSCAVTYRSA